MNIPAVIPAGSAVLFVWHSQSEPEKVKMFVESLHTKLLPNGKVQVENIDRLLMCKYFC